MIKWIRHIISLNGKSKEVENGLHKEIDTLRRNREELGKLTINHDVDWFCDLPVVKECNDNGFSSE